MELKGKIIHVLDKRTGVSKKDGNPWSTQEFVIETEEQYPRKMVFSVFGEDKLRQMDIKVGETLTVSFDIDAREYQGRWYNDIRAWRVQRDEVEQAPQQPAQPKQEALPFPDAEPSNTYELPY